MPLSQEQPKVLKYWTLIEHLRRQIALAQLGPGDRAPSLAEMQAQFGVSRATVEKAYTLLEQEGLLVREQGRGTFIAVKSTEVSRPTPVIGLLIRTGDANHPYMLPLLNGIREAAERLDMELLWLNQREPSRWNQLSGVLFYQAELTTDLYQLPHELPRVSILRPMDGTSFVTTDDFEGARLATRHLLKQGHRKIAYLLSSREDYFSRRRLAGYEAALREADIEPDSRWINTLSPEKELSYLTKGEQAMRLWLREDWRQLGCTALLTANDETAISAIKVLRESGIRTPEDISVVGFDGTEISELCTPRLTTVRVPLREVGIRAVELLHEQPAGQFGSPREIVLPVQLKWGESTAPPV